MLKKLFLKFRYLLLISKDEAYVFLYLARKFIYSFITGVSRSLSKAYRAYSYSLTIPSLLLMPLKYETATKPQILSRVNPLNNLSLFVCEFIYF